MRESLSGSFTFSSPPCWSNFSSLCVELSNALTCEMSSQLQEVSSLGEVPSSTNEFPIGLCQSLFFRTAGRVRGRPPRGTRPLFHEVVLFFFF